MVQHHAKNPLIYLMGIPSEDISSNLNCTILVNILMDRRIKIEPISDQP